MFQKNLKNLMSLIKHQKYQEAKVEEELQATITHHPNGLIVLQLNQPLQSIFLSAEEACAIAKALLLEARRVRIGRISNGTNH